MKDWKAIATACKLGIPEPDVDRIVPSLDALESIFRPLAKSIPYDVEPAIVFRAGAASEE
jgi:hypothetical protein